jgi:hypothetical protein
MIVLDGDEAFRDKLAAGGHYAATTEHSWNRVVGAYKALYLDVLRESARHAD